MDKHEFVDELAEVRRICKRMSPAQIKETLKSLKRDLRDRGREESTGIEVDDVFVRRDKTEGDDKGLWAIRRRHKSPLLALAECADGGTLVALMRLTSKIKREMKALDTWSGWHLVADPGDLTDQEWERLQDGTQFLNVAAAEQTPWVKPERQPQPATPI